MTDNYAAAKMVAVFCNFQIEGVHKSDFAYAPEFERHPHRHMFHFKVTLNAAGDDAEELISPMKLRAMCLDQFKSEHSQPYYFVAWSSLQIADWLAGALWEAFGGRGVRVDVAEDGENGATVTYGQHIY